VSHLNKGDNKIEPWIKERYLSLYCCVRTASNSCFYDHLCDIYGYLSGSQDQEDLERPLNEIEKMLQSSLQTEQTMRGEGNQIVSININNGSGSFFMRD
jgi:hypothetical protein